MTLMIGNNSVVSIHYTLKNEAGDVIDSSEDNQPLVYLHSSKNLIPGLESELHGKSSGASRLSGYADSVIWCGLSTVAACCHFASKTSNDENCVNKNSSSDGLPAGSATKLLVT